MTVLVVAGTGTGVGKTACTAAYAATAAAAGERVAALKPAQTGVRPGEPGDADEVARLVPEAEVRELARYPEPLAPATAARRSCLPPVTARQAAEAAADLAAEHDLVLVEGAGGLLVRLNDRGETIADVAAELSAQVLLVVRPGLGTLNETALTAEALAARGLTCAGLVIGRWPAFPGLAERCNLDDLPTEGRAPLLGALPEGITALPPAAFATASVEALGIPEHR
ncbi:ATP-dependent dethiobiotin synthetase BioD [Nocardiopsis sp. CNT-189]|uniref:dethiobiotin synthase n=1 Tax=Nocardiopsis oceanisediminis TaxID=2816862 RepID=UPI003B35B206